VPGHAWETRSLEGPLQTFGVFTSGHYPSVDLSREHVSSLALLHCGDVKTPGELCSPELARKMYLTVSATAVLHVTTQKPLSQLSWWTSPAFLL